MTHFEVWQEKALNTLLRECLPEEEQSVREAMQKQGVRVIDDALIALYKAVGL